MPKPKGLFRIAALGGSSTYCVSVSDDQTWEAYLGNDLGPSREVLNFGIPGATSVESTIQSALLFSDVQPDVALYYLGWNDARVQHVKHLRPDWADYHGKSMMAIGLSGNEMKEPCAAAYLIKRAVFRYFFPKMNADAISRTVLGDEDQLTDRIDARALRLYVRNLENITALCRVQHVRPIFIPQVLNYEALNSEKRYGWLPFVRDKDLKKVISVYNDATRNFAERENVGFIKEVLEVEFGTEDFFDQGHFTAKGNVKFAKAVAAGLRRMAVCNDAAGTDSVSPRNELGTVRDR
jgi:lysophospholipase L1-like esterase